MEKFIPLEKRSKKEKRSYHASQRGSWFGVNPSKRVFPDRKKFQKSQRGKVKAELRQGRGEIC